jgi:hypothetical protein
MVEFGLRRGEVVEAGLLLGGVVEVGLPWGGAVEVGLPWVGDVETDLVWDGGRRTGAELRLAAVLLARVCATVRFICAGALPAEVGLLDTDTALVVVVDGGYREDSFLAGSCAGAADNLVVFVEAERCSEADLCIVVEGTLAVRGTAGLLALGQWTAVEAVRCSGLTGSLLGEAAGAGAGAWGSGHCASAAARGAGRRSERARCSEDDMTCFAEFGSRGMTVYFGEHGLSRGLVLLQ